MNKKINFLGVEVEVVPDEDLSLAPPGSVYMIIRVADAMGQFGSPQLQARRMKIRCDDCREACWFDPAGGWLKLPEGTPRVCIQCVTIRGRAEKAADD